MTGLSVTQGGTSRGTARLALLGAALALVLAIVVPLALLSHPAHGVELPPSAQTQQQQGNVHGRSNVNSRAQQLSRAQAVALVQHRYRARVVRTHLLQDAHGHPFYEFRLLSAGGRVWNVRIDAYSGAELP